MVRHIKSACGARRMTKYRAVKCQYDGITFDSKKERARYIELKILEKAGEISHLRLQVPFVLVPKEKDAAGRTLRAVKYYADFVYFDKNERLHIEDVKGVRTKEYILKKRLMWHINRLNIEEV